MILSAATIQREIKLVPFNSRTVHSESGMSYGLSHCGYDVRIRESVDMMPGGFVLASILEHISMPLDVVGIVHDKSTLARMGLALQNTVIEPGWRGYLTIEISNHGHEFIRIIQGQPIAQIVFHRVDAKCEPYTGKYQDQPPQPVEGIRESVAEALGFRRYK